MMHAYDKLYLSKAQNNLASMLDFAVYDLKEDLGSFYKKFLLSKISTRFEQGESTIIAGKSGVELALEVVEDFSKAKNYRPVANRSPEFWVGWVLAYFQWYSNFSFKQIESLVPITEILTMYNPYHEMDISQICEKLFDLCNARNSNLK